MATILEFRRPEEAPSHSRETSSSEPKVETAEIIIFPGVRIERSGPPAGEVAAKSTGRSERGGTVRAD